MAASTSAVSSQRTALFSSGLQRMGAWSCLLYTSKALMQKWGVDARYAGVGHCILGYAAAEPAPAKARKADVIVRV